MSNITSSVTSTISFQSQDNARNTTLAVDERQYAFIQDRYVGSSVVASTYQSQYAATGFFLHQAAPPYSLMISERILQNYLISSATSEITMKDCADAIASFRVGRPIYFRLLSPPVPPYTTHTTVGNVIVEATSIPYAIQETLTFSQVKKMRLAHEPYGSVSWKWLGKVPGALLFTGQEVSIQGGEDKPIAVLEVTYLTLTDRLKLITTYADRNIQTSAGIEYIPEAELPVTVSVLKDEEIQASISVSFGSRIPEDEAFPPEENPDDPDTSTVSVNICVKDFCTDVEIANVEVRIDGVYKGRTDNYGIISIGEYLEGSTHSMQFLSSNHLDSSADVLYNDEFTVPLQPDPIEEEEDL